MEFESAWVYANMLIYSGIVHKLMSNSYYTHIFISQLWVFVIFQSPFGVFIIILIIYIYDNHTIVGSHKDFTVIYVNCNLRPDIDEYVCLFIFRI
jgi:hypothetical protein